MANRTICLLVVACTLYPETGSAHRLTGTLIATVKDAPWAAHL